MRVIVNRRRIMLSIILSSHSCEIVSCDALSRESITDWKYRSKWFPILRDKSPKVENISGLATNGAFGF